MRWKRFLDERNEKIDALREKKSGILGQVQDQGFDPRLLQNFLMEEQQCFSAASDQLTSKLLSGHPNAVCFVEM